MLQEETCARSARCEFSESPLDNYANQNYIGAIPCLHEGTLRIVHGSLARVAMDVAASGGLARRTRRPRRTAKSCGPGAATVASILSGPCWGGNGDNQRRSPGRARISRQTLRGESRDVSAVPVALPACFGTRDARVLRCTGSTGAVSARLSLRPLSERGTTRLQNPGELESRECLNSSFRDAPLGAGPESIATIGSMDSGLALRAPRNDERIGCLTFKSAIAHAIQRAPPPPYSTGITSTSTRSFCLREPTMMPSIGETSEKSRPVASTM